MRGAMRIGRLFGIDLTVDSSWGFIFLLLTWNLTDVFDRWHPRWSLGLSFVVAFTAAVLFFASVVAHELAHALVASSFGITVRQIRLFLFGGVSDIEREPSSPRAEAWMAIAGPALSIGVGLFLCALAGASLAKTVTASTDPIPLIAAMTPFQTLILWLGPVNLGVGIFNLVPAFPLDGGRVLRAFLWWRTGDLHRATWHASRVGRAAGLAFIVIGVAMVAGIDIPYFGRGIGGLWIACIGWFLRRAADRSFGALVTEELLDGVQVASMMHRNGTVLPPTLTLREAVDDWLPRSNEHAFPVIDDGHLLGLLCLTDLQKVPRDVWSRTPVTQVMTPTDALVVVRPALDAHAALQKLGELDVDQLPVLENGLLVGMLSRSDVARFFTLKAA